MYNVKKELTLHQMNSNPTEASIRQWRSVTDTYTSSSLENLEYQKLYDLTPQQLFLLDLADDFIRSSDPVAAQEWRDAKQAKLDECAKLYRLTGAL